MKLVLASPGATNTFPWKQLLILTAGWRLSLFLIQFFSIRILGLPWSLSYIAWQTFGLWDGYWHIHIARYGYDVPGLTLRFPLYPLLIRLFAPVFFGSELAAALTISFIFFFLAILFFYRLALLELRSDQTTLRAILYLLLFPSAFFFVAAYGESLFLFLTVASFYFFRRERFFLASFLGGLASLTRLQGLLLFPSFILERLVRKRRWEWRNLYFFLIPLALVPWCWFLWRKFGDPFLFLADLSKWGEGPWQRARVVTSPLTALFSYLDEISHFIQAIGGGVTPQLLVQLKELLDFFFFLLFLILGILISRRLRLSYNLYYFLSLLMMLSVGTLKGAPRLVVVLFPGFFVLAKLIRKTWLIFLFLSLSTVGLVWFLLLFSLHFWVS